MDEDYTETSWTYFMLCVEGNLHEGLRFAKDLLIPNVILRLAIQFIPVPHNVRHSLSLVIGSFLLYYIIGPLFLWIVGLTTGAYILIILLSFITRQWRGLLMCIFVISFLIFCEVYAMNPVIWQQIRGIQMIAAMKIISVAIELDRDLFKKMLNPVEFAGYIFCPANCILGPWISFHTYNKYLDVKFLSKRWVRIIIVNIFMAMLFLLMSTCIVPWYIEDNSNKWLVAYRDAQSFRMSHYFISSMSIISMVSAGFGLTNDCHCDLQVTKPLFVELPRSLVQVVIYWNIPIHQWLKNYIFKPCQRYGHFTAILVTYIVSSLLHGLNFQFSAVLLSIGTFSYIEYNLRCKVAAALEVCCLANPCVKQCDHKHKKNSLIAIISNGVFSIITIVHLAYLGVMFEVSFSIKESGYSYLNTMSKWENLNYFSHTFAAFLYVINLMM